MGRVDARTILKPWLYGKPNGDGEWRGFCAYCEVPGKSKSPSASYHLGMGVWHCMGKCGAGGSTTALARKIKNNALPSQKPDDETPDNVVDLDSKRPSRPLPNKQKVAFFCKNLLTDTSAHRYITERRGLNDETLKTYNIGWDGRQRYLIPIYDEDGRLVNIRKYKPNAHGNNKMISWGIGHGEGRIYGFDTLKKSEWVLLCEGELDRLIALQHGLPAITHTAGANTFKVEWAKHFKDKDVYIAYDEDQAGDKGAQKVRRVLEGTARSIHRVKLDTGIKGGDVTDFFLACGRRFDDMMEVIKSAKCWYRADGDHQVPDHGKPVSVEESQNANHNYPIEMTVMVAGKQDPPYIAPKRLTGRCDMSAQPAKCASCYFFANEGERTIDINPDNKDLLKAIGASDKGLQLLYQSLTEAKCNNHIAFEIDEAYTIEELAITPSVEHRTEDVEIPIHRTVFNVGTYKTPVNQLARIVGQQRPAPSNQRGIIHGWVVDPVKSDLDTFTMTDDVHERLSRFQVADGQTPLEKCIEIAEDLAANVTRIYGRPALHVGYDLVWHSAISFMFEGKPITKGWLECLVLGDTRTGKSETAAALCKHYQAGIMKPLEGASFAGLVGGNDKMQGDHFMVKWGLIPLNDRRLCVLDEMSGLYARRESKGIIEEMSSIRSEGKAQISKIASAETSARTRLIWLSNPLNSMSLAESSGGSLTALNDLIRNPEDIARFDFMMAAAQNDVPSSIINSTKHRRVRHRYTQQACSELVMWAWSRRTDQVKFLRGVEEYIYAAAEDLGSRYVPDPPLIQIANARVKIARIAVALAARTFSTDRSGTKIVVKRAHVKSAVQFLDMIYGEQAMGYKDQSERVMENRRRAEKAKVEARKYLKQNPSLVETLLAVGATDFRKRDFEEFGGVDREDVGVIIPKLLGWRLITRKSRGYMAMEPALVELLRELESEGG